MLNVVQGGDQLEGDVLQQDQARVQGDAHEARHDHEQGRDIHQVYRQSMSKDEIFTRYTDIL